MYGPPANLASLCRPSRRSRRVADLKGKRIGVTTAGSLTDWLVRELSRQQGWGNDGIAIEALGQMQARLAAMDRGELDGFVLEAATGFELEEQAAPATSCCSATSSSISTPMSSSRPTT